MPLQFMPKLMASAVSMAQKLNKDTDPRVQQFFIESYSERDMGRKASWTGVLCFRPAERIYPMPKRVWVYAGLSAIWLFQSLNRPGGNTVGSLINWVIVSIIAIVLTEEVYKFFARRDRRRQESYKNPPPAENRFGKWKKIVTEKLHKINWFKFFLALAALLVAGAIVYSQVIQPMINRHNFWKCIKINSGSVQGCSSVYPIK